MDGTDWVWEGWRTAQECVTQCDAGAPPPHLVYVVPTSARKEKIRMLRNEGTSTMPIEMAPKINVNWNGVGGQGRECGGVRACMPCGIEWAGTKSCLTVGRAGGCV